MQESFNNFKNFVGSNNEVNVELSVNNEKMSLRIRIPPVIEEEEEEEEEEKEDEAESPPPKRRKVDEHKEILQNKTCSWWNKLIVWLTMFMTMFQKTLAKAYEGEKSDSSWIICPVVLIFAVLISNSCIETEEKYGSSVYAKTMIGLSMMIPILMTYILYRKSEPIAVCVSS